MSYPANFWVDIVKVWEGMFKEYHRNAPDSLLRTFNVVKNLVDLIKSKYPDFEYPDIIRRFALSRTKFRMRALIRKLAAERKESARARRKKLDLEISSTTTSAKRVQCSSLFLIIWFMKFLHH